MAEVVIIVDDVPQTTATLAYQIGEEIVRQSNDKVKIHMIDNVIISDAKDTVTESISRITADGDDIILGILIDLYEEVDPLSGAKLLKKLMSEPDPCAFPVIIFTGKLINISYQELIGIGARDVIQRDLVGGQAPYKKIAAKVLESFNRSP